MSCSCTWRSCATFRPSTLPRSPLHRRDSLSAVLNRTASQYSEVDNSADSLNAAYTLLDARLGYESDHWSLVAYGRNLLDEFYTTDRFAMPADAGRSEAGIARSYGDGRSYGLQVELRF